jgi:uncharacterized protein
MEAYYLYLNELVNTNRLRFSAYTDIHWINQYEAIEAQQKRDRLLSCPDIRLLFKSTKPYHKQLSKGCLLCGQGLWSCLFITGKCNAACFYCPASQKADDQPQTQSLLFETPGRYVDYINHFGFSGVSFSGGEPLLFFDRTLDYLKHVREWCTPDLYIWMYTNGILGTRQKYCELAAAGLNEVRFDIGATSYKLDNIRHATGCIENITIEIPAVPEEKERIKSLLPDMVKLGVTNLNLHQLRLTDHNAPKLTQHPYTFIPAEQPVVLESELAALEILNFARAEDIPIGINYCSFHFKNRFQKAGFRRRIGNKAAFKGAYITEQGFTRNYNPAFLAYEWTSISKKPQYTTMNTSIPLRFSDKSYYLNNTTIMQKRLEEDALIMSVENLFAGEPPEKPAEKDLFDIWQKEYIEAGLREY